MSDKVQGTSNQDPNYRREQLFQKKKEEKEEQNKEQQALSFEQADAYEHSKDNQLKKMLYSQDPQLQKKILKKINTPQPHLPTDEK